MTAAPPNMTVETDLRVKPELEDLQVHRKPYPRCLEEVEEIEHRIQECFEIGFVNKDKDGKQCALVLPLRWACWVAVVLVWWCSCLNPRRSCSGTLDFLVDALIDGHYACVV